jgi:RNA polymerase primary sigma factor
LLKLVSQLRQDHAQYVQAKQAMCEANLRLVVAIARRYRPWGSELMELLQEGNVGLMRAVDKFEYRRGFRFCTCAMWWIRQAVMRAVARQGLNLRAISSPASPSGDLDSRGDGEGSDDSRGIPRRSRRPRGLGRRQRPVSLDDATRDNDKPLRELLVDHRSGERNEEEDRQLMRDRIAQSLSRLGYREREILKLRYGLGDGFCYRLEDVGYIFGVTRERARQLEQRALRKLRHDARIAELPELLNWLVETRARASARCPRAVRVMV